jgi:hypothetical protein
VPEKRKKERIVCEKEKEKGRERERVRLGNQKKE